MPSSTGGPNVLEILSANPWLVAVAEIAFVPLVGVVVGIVCISVNVCRRKIRLAQFDFELKRDMLQRGFSAEDIRTVIEAGRREASNNLLQQTVHANGGVQDFNVKPAGGRC
jgi:hypothetical protein